mgnify:CR=1 FL=1
MRINQSKMEFHLFFCQRSFHIRNTKTLDEFKLLKAQLDKQNGVTNKDVAQNQNPDQDSEGDDKDRTRKKSDKNMNNYRKIVIADDSEAEQRYTSDYRGRVQDKNVNITLEPMFALTYYEKMSDVKRSVNFHKYVEELNRSGVLPKRLRITNMEAPLGTSVSAVCSAF